MLLGNRRFWLVLVVATRLRDMMADSLFDLTIIYDCAEDRRKTSVGCFGECLESRWPTIRLGIELCVHDMTVYKMREIVLLTASNSTLHCQGTEDRDVVRRQYYLFAKQTLRDLGMFDSRIGSESNHGNRSFQKIDIKELTLSLSPPLSFSPFPPFPLPLSLPLFLSPPLSPFHRYR